MVSAGLENVAPCAKCGLLTPPQRIHKGWCLDCVAQWAESTDPWLIYQSQSQLPSGVVIASKMRQIERLQEKVMEPIPDEAFLPLTRFMGARGVGHLRTWWNTLTAAYLFEHATTAAVSHIGHNTLHLCGRHSAVQRCSLQGFLSRMHSAGDEFKLLRADKRLLDYVRGFVSDNRLLLFTYRPTSVDVYDRAYQIRFTAKYGKPHFDKHSPAFWPFESAREAHKREHGLIEQLPDVIMDVGELIPKRMPETLREDLCQDLCVAVLSGEATVDGLRDPAALKRYISEAFKHHPLRYGRYSLDSPQDKNSDAQGDRWSAALTSDDISPERADRGWLGELCVDPDSRSPRLHGLATLGDVARANNDGHAIDGPDVIQHEESEMDEDIAAVFYADQNPQWRKRYSD